MESPFSISSPATVNLLTISKSLEYRCFLPSRCRPLPPSSSIHQRSTEAVLSCSSSSSSLRLRTPYGVVPPVRRRSDFGFCSAASSGTASTGGNDGGGDFGNGGGGEGGGGGKGADSSDSESNLVSGAADEVSVLPSDVIMLHVGGMTCGGCAASVKRILESQPQVSSASVDLTRETAIVWPVSEAKALPNWQKQLGEALAKHLTTCGFTSNLQGHEATERKYFTIEMQKDSV